MWKHFVKEYFNFTLKERAGIIILLVIIGICFCIPFLYPYFIHHKTYDYSKFDSDIAKLKMQQVDTSKKYYAKNFDEDNYNNYNEPSEKRYYTNPKAEVFNFDPNTASAGDWKRLGIRDKTIATIQKYLSKGGHFYKPEDISKIWGLHKDDVTRLLPYVTIENKKNDYSKNDYANSGGKQNNYTNNTFTKEKKADIIVDVNSADTTAFIALPGIGSKLAQRIINFREKLGGFYSVEQVGQTFGLPDSTFQKIKQKLVLNNASVKKLNINTASVDELKVHPYIRYNLANAIIQYRSQHGNFSSVNDIKNIMLVNDEIFNKVSPYLIAEK